MCTWHTVLSAWESILVSRKREKSTKKMAYNTHFIIPGKHTCVRFFTCIFSISSLTAFTLKMDYNENSHIKLTIEPCLCCVQVTIYCCGHVFLFIILVQFDRQNETPLLRFLKFPALHWFPTKDPLEIHYEIHDIVPVDL